jgi:hypothetical protein
MTGPQEVGLAHVAGMHGISERDLVGRMSELLAAGRLMYLLRVEAQARLYEWLDGKESSGDPFAVMFRLSANRGIDVAMYCKCYVDMGGDEPLIRVDDTFVSVAGYDKGLGKAFEVGLKDLEIGETHE